MKAAGVPDYSRQEEEEDDHELDDSEASTLLGTPSQVGSNER